MSDLHLAALMAILALAIIWSDVRSGRIEGDEP